MKNHQFTFNSNTMQSLIVQQVKKLLPENIKVELEHHQKIVSDDLENNTELALSNYLDESANNLYTWSLEPCRPNLYQIKHYLTIATLRELVDRYSKLDSEDQYNLASQLLRLSQIIRQDVMFPASPFSSPDNLRQDERIIFIMQKMRQTRELEEKWTGERVYGPCAGDLLPHNFFCNTSRRDRPIIVALEGNIGAGKSTLLRNVKDCRLNDGVVFVVPESVDYWNDLKWLENFYKDPEVFGPLFQSFLLYQLKHQYQTVLSENPNVKMIVFERSIATSVKVFCHEYKLGEIFYKDAERIINDCPIDYHFYLDTNPELCFERVGKRGRPQEASMKLEYLVLLQQRHDAWLKHREGKDVFVTKEAEYDRGDVFYRLAMVLNRFEKLPEASEIGKYFYEQRYPYHYINMCYLKYGADDVVGEGKDYNIGKLESLRIKDNLKKLSSAKYYYTEM